MIGLRFNPWNRFQAKRDRSVDRRFLDAVAHESEDAFKQGLASGKSGVKYPNLPNRSSAAGEYPANQSGRLRGSISSVSNSRRVIIGSNTFYSKFLRNGTKKMGARKMSDEALKEGVPKARSILRGWVEWKKQ